MTIDGHVDGSFLRMRDAFGSCFSDGLEHGASVAVVKDGKTVVELWGGHRDAQGTRAWERDTLVNVWSTTKGVTALAVAMLVEQGKLSYDKPISFFWPEFAAGGKEAITLDLAMSHQAGLNGLSVSMSDQGLYDWFPYVEALAAMAPLWEPGSRFVYHAVSYGHLAGEPLRRVDGRTIGRFVHDEIAVPLDVAFYIGLPEAYDDRVAELIEGHGNSAFLDVTLSGPYPNSCKNPSLTATRPNERAWRAAEIPGANGHATAHALARIYGLLVTSKSANRPISLEGLRESCRVRFRGTDVSVNETVTYGAGFRLEDPGYGARASKESFGHAGWGGSLAFADPEAGVGFAFTTCRMLGWDDGIDRRAQRLVEALYDCL